MANPVDVREVFPVTENASTGAGVGLTSVQPGSASAGVNGAVGFAFQDVNGNVVLPQLNNLGQLPVTQQTPGQRLRTYGRSAGSLLSATGASYTGMNVVCSIAASGGLMTGDFGAKVSCRKGAYFELIYQDTVNTVVLDSTIVDAGQYTAPLGLGPSEDIFSVPASGVSPTFQIRGGNFGTISDLHGVLAVTQF